ncbi:MAG: DUF1887 family protein [Syntrophorhabdaceae bacterium]|nr:DUF1887 family protein [Syntrophorhabdaceae bacterium]
MERYNFVSIVGTQIMSILNPLLSLIEGEEGKFKPFSITLFVTSEAKSQANGEKITRFLIQKGYYRKDCINIVRISDGLLSHGDLHPIHKHIEKIAGGKERILFNIAGGMNFQIAASLYFLPGDLFDIVYPEDTGIHKITFDKGKLTDYKLLPLPRPVDVLSLQDVKTFVKREGVLTGASFAKRYNLPIPEGTYDVNINSITFDCIWNRGNNLLFFKTILDKSFDGKKKKDKILDQTRRLLALAETRVYFKELFHRNIIVLTDIASVKERLQRESKGKIITISSFDELRTYLEHPPLEEEKVIGNLETYRTGKEVEGKGTLYLALAKDLLPVLIAIWSHKPKKVVFFYTPNNPAIEKIKSTIINYKQLMPLEEISFFRCSVFGSAIYGYPGDGKEYEPPMVNITPGTKGQASFLSLLARKNGFPLFSINTRTGELEGISSDSRIELSGPDPLSLLLLTGQNVAEKGYGITKDEILKDKDLQEGILQFFRLLKKSNDTKDMLTKGISTPLANLYVFREEEKMRIVYKRDENKSLEWSSRDNEWFENLIGYVMCFQGADDVRVRMCTARENPVNHLTEVDVVARFKSDYFVISCKAGGLNIQKDASEITAVASLFGRFAVPLLASIEHMGDPAIKEGVYIFGPSTFSNKERMARFLEDAISNKRKLRV